MLDNCEHLLGPVSALAENVLRECRGGADPGHEPRGPRGRRRARVAVAVVAAARRDRRADGDERRGASVRGTGRGGAGEFRVGRRRTSTRSRRSVGVSMGSRWRSSWRRRGGGVDVPVEIATLLDERFRLLTGGRRTRGGTPSDVAGDGRLVVLAARASANGWCSTASGCSRAASTRRRRPRSWSGDGIEALGRARRARRRWWRSRWSSPTTTADGTTRYRMLETLRQYARERTRRGRRRPTGGVVVTPSTSPPGPKKRARVSTAADELAWRAREVAELDNLRAAVTWALDRDDPDDIGLALRIIGALAYESQVNPAAGVGAWAEQALPHVEITSPQLRYAVTAAAARSPSTTSGTTSTPKSSRAPRSATACPSGPPHPASPTCRLGSVRRCSGNASERWRSLLDAARLLDRDFPGSRVRCARSCDGSHVRGASRAIPIARAEAEIALRHGARDRQPLGPRRSRSWRTDGL